ncbi:MAG: AAA-like domain-containing protein [Microcoleaceae cyanobacterium]
MEELIALASALVRLKTGDSLNYVQRMVLAESLQDAKKTYDRIAVEKGYSPSYLKNGVAPKLWCLLSEAIGEKVSKINCRFLLEQQLKSGSSQGTFDAASSYTSVLSERPGGQVPLTSPFYIERSPVDLLCNQEILKPRALLRLKAPRQMGKTSLMVRLLEFSRQKGYRVIQLSLNQADSRVFDSTEAFLRWLCFNATRQLGLDPNLDQFWDTEMGSLVSCTLYLQERVLRQIQRPVVLAIDEVSQLFHYPILARDVLALLRSWYEETRDISVWQHFRLLLVNSTDVYITLNANKSPFNVGLTLEIPPFTVGDVRELAQRHGLKLSNASLAHMVQFLGGFPYLIRLALYHAVAQDTEVDQLLENEASITRIYGEHLQEQTWQIQQSPELFEMYRQVVMSQGKVFLGQSQGSKLQSMGLIHLVDDHAIVGCQLYKRHFWRLYQKNDIMTAPFSSSPGNRSSLA